MRREASYGKIDSTIFRSATPPVVDCTCLQGQLPRTVLACFAPIPNVSADSFEGLLVNYVEKRAGQAVIRGLRAVSDFEFEFQLALMNRKLNERVETIFMMPKETYTFLSSRMVKEIARLGGDVSAFVPPTVRAALIKKLATHS